tara:strand:+ start:1616 stop:1789 length:174 start_codon:yes stop_codon:yes gene_type:complete
MHLEVYVVTVALNSILLCDVYKKLDGGVWYTLDRKEEVLVYMPKFKPTIYKTRVLIH